MKVAAQGDTQVLLAARSKDFNAPCGEAGGELEEGAQCSEYQPECVGCSTNLLALAQLLSYCETGKAYCVLYLSLG